MSTFVKNVLEMNLISKRGMVKDPGNSVLRDQPLLPPSKKVAVTVLLTLKNPMR